MKNSVLNASAARSAGALLELRLLCEVTAPLSLKLPF